MKTIRFLRPFISTHRVAISGSDLAVTPVGESDVRHLIIRSEKSRFVPDEEVEVQNATIEEKRRLFVGNIDQRMGAILDDAVEGADFEYVS